MLSFSSIASFLFKAMILLDIFSNVNFLIKIEFFELISLGIVRQLLLYFSSEYLLKLKNCKILFI